jgi:hypothetical protein
MNSLKKKLRVGDWVEVRSKEEILSTLDSTGRLDGMPFMPEMIAFCGKKFQVYKRAHKTCDTVFPVRGRRIERAVHLKTRCDGSFHGGCQAGCLIFWKEAWLKPVSRIPQQVHVDATRGARPSDSVGTGSSVCSEFNVIANMHLSGDESQRAYVCQATQLPYASSDLPWWDLRQYAEDYTSGNVGLWRFVCGLAYFFFLWLSQAGIGLGRPIRWVYDHFYFLWRGSPFPRRGGQIPAGEPTPVQTLNLQPGELVRIKPYQEILKTLNTQNRNRGLYFDAEEVPYCGRTYRVLRRVERILNERTGKLQEMKVPCIVLDSVICEARYSECRLFCPRSIHSYWREIWLERVTTQNVSKAEVETRQCVESSK